MEEFNHSNLRIKIIEPAIKLIAMNKALACSLSTLFQHDFVLHYNEREGYVQFEFGAINRLLPVHVGTMVKAINYFEMIDSQKLKTIAIFYPNENGVTFQFGDYIPVVY